LAHIHGHPGHPAAIDAFRSHYDTDRPHQSLDMAFPADRFTRRGAPGGAGQATCLFDGAGGAASLADTGGALSRR
jgi:hypothetical protein